MLTTSVCVYVCVCVKLLCVGCVYAHWYTHVGVYLWAGLDLRSEARKERDAWRNLPMRLINSLATLSRFIKWCEG